MIASLVFGCGLAATVMAAVGVVGYLNGPLRRQLLELCGSAERVAFWAAFANVAVVLMPAIFAMSVEPDSAAPVSPLIAIAEQLKWGFIGLVASVLTMGWILGRFIRRASVVSLTPHPEKK